MKKNPAVVGIGVAPRALARIAGGLAIGSGILVDDALQASATGERIPTLIRPCRSTGPRASGGPDAPLLSLAPEHASGS